MSGEQEADRGLAHELLVQETLLRVVGSGGVLAYDDLESLEISGQGRLPTLYCDMAGDAALTHAVHTHLGADLVHSCAVGRTHVTADGGGADALPGPCDPADLAQIGLRRF